MRLRPDGSLPRAFCVAACVEVLVAVACGGAAAPPPGILSTPPSQPVDLSRPWTAAAPAEVGMDARSLELGASRAGRIPRFRSLLVARRGRLAFERYFAGAGADTALDVRSVTKSVVSALTGIALRDHVLPGLDTPIAPYLDPPYRFHPSDTGITVRHLLTMTSGYDWDDDRDYNPWVLSDDRVQFLLDRPRAAPPGERFTYDSAAVHVLGVVLQRAAGLPLPQYASEQLFGPLAAEGVAWEVLDRGTVNGGSGIDLRGRDLLKLGQLYLQRGFSADRSVVPADWVSATTAPQFGWRDDYGAQHRVTYGMLWWVSDETPAAYFAWGYGGQFVYVVPSRDLVVVATTEWRGLTETTPLALAEEVLGVIVDDVVAAASS
jgi:CubicO group peptidase (beta-lactamase class C family)